MPVFDEAVDEVGLARAVDTGDGNDGNRFIDVE